MKNNVHDTPTERIEQVVGLVRMNVAKSEQPALERFVREYFRQVDPEDLAERLPEDLYGIALSHWSFARRRPAGTAKLRVFNPAIEEHGWQSTHTVVEIVNDDMPFLVDSVTMAVNRCGLTLHLIMHPIVTTKRDASGQLVELAANDEGTGESFMHVEVDRISERAQMERLTTELESALHDVRVAVTDWKAMVANMHEIIANLDRHPLPIPAEELAEARAFLEWLAADHFTFLGYRNHDLVSLNGEDGLKVVPGSGLGILSTSGESEMSASFAALPPNVRERARLPEALIVTKANARSTVHRPGYLDYIGIKRFNERGEVAGEHRFLGLYTSAAYMAGPRDIPLLRRKVAAVAQRAQLPPQSHSGKALTNILDTYPRDELFQISTDELFETALGILHLGERQRLRLFVRRDPFERFISCLIYAPREHYNTVIRLKWQTILTDAFNGAFSEFNVFLSESTLARILITVHTKPGALPD
ncbi:MAG: glutamate dehydrogenase, partial [Betaproteobacteria bacterium]